MASSVYHEPRSTAAAQRDGRASTAMVRLHYEHSEERAKL